MAEFTETFEVRDGTEEDYKAFIERLRNLVRDPGVEVDRIPVLRPQAQQNQTIRFFDVILQDTPSRSVRLRIRLDNLYLVGYRDEHGNEWHEFNDGRQLIHPSTFLPFGSSYGQLGHREETLLGREALIQAVNRLRSSSSDIRDRRRALLVIIQMVCESTRFTYITNAIASNYWTGFRPDQVFLRLENSWRSISRAFLQRNDTSTGNLQLPEDSLLGITTRDEAQSVLGICLRPVVGSRPRLEIGMESQALIPDGRPLVEVFGVRITDTGGKGPSDLYGTITATDGLQSYYLYDRARRDREPILPGGHVTLTGPSRAITADDNFVIDFDLMKYNSQSPDDEVSQGSIEWNVYSHLNVYDDRRSETIRGRSGSAELSYVVLSFAAEALVEVVLVPGNEKDPANVYGRIYSEISSFNEEIELFNKSAENRVDVRPGSPIPLLRSALAVPLNESLRIGANLKISPDDEIANGIAEIDPVIMTSASRFIKGGHGQVEVRITWK